MGILHSMDEMDENCMDDTHIHVDEEEVEEDSTWVAALHIEPLGKT